MDYPEAPSDHSTALSDHTEVPSDHPENPSDLLDTQIDRPDILWSQPGARNGHSELKSGNLHWHQVAQIGLLILPSCYPEAIQCPQVAVQRP